MKKLLIGVSLFLGFLGTAGYSICLAVPGAAPWCPIGKTVIDGAKVAVDAAAAKELDSCTDSVCQRAPDGKAGIVGTIWFPDGGTSCKCK